MSLVPALVSRGRYISKFEASLGMDQVPGQSRLHREIMSQTTTRPKQTKQTKIQNDRISLCVGVCVFMYVYTCVNVFTHGDQWRHP